jgi:hypothetical protein
LAATYVSEYVVADATAGTTSPKARTAETSSPTVFKYSFMSHPDPLENEPTPRRASGAS